MRAAEFDKFADEYLAAHTANLKISGEAPEYFARYKIDELRRRWTRAGYAEPRAILDFGSGIGASLPHLAEAFPGAALTALDVSARSLAISEARFPGIANRVCYDGQGPLPAPDGGFDLVFMSCVLHHIDHDEHARLVGELRRLLTPDGALVVFEHNPANPVTRYIVATCPFDENAVLIRPRALSATMREAGFTDVDVRFTGFFPNALAFLRGFEPALAKLPVGAQYYLLARG
jgi:SAM-dependent methyltransferase